MLQIKTRIYPLKGDIYVILRRIRDAAEPFFVCGDGRTRTAVQTPHQRAFYTLSLPLVFDVRLPGDRLSCAYPLNLNGA